MTTVAPSTHEIRSKSYFKHHLLAVCCKANIEATPHQGRVSKFQISSVSMEQMNRSEHVSTFYSCCISGEDRKDEFFIYLKDLPSLNSLCVTYTYQHVNVFMNMTEPMTVNDIALILMPLCPNHQLSISSVSLDYLDSMTRDDWLPLSQNISSKFFSFSCQAYKWVMTTNTFSWMDPFVMEYASVSDFLHKLFQELHPSPQ